MIFIDFEKIFSNLLNTIPKEFLAMLMLFVLILGYSLLSLFMSNVVIFGILAVFVLIVISAGYLILKVKGKNKNAFQYAVLLILLINFPFVRSLEAIPINSININDTIQANDSCSIEYREYNDLEFEKLNNKLDDTSEKILMLEKKLIEEKNQYSTINIVLPLVIINIITLIITILYFRNFNGK